MSESRLRRIEEKLNALIPKAVWLLSNYNSVGTGPCAPCPPCVAGETPAAAETVPAESVATFTPLDPEVWPFHDDETSANFTKKLKQPEYIHFFKSQGLGVFLNMVKARPGFQASEIRLLILSKLGKTFKTLPENKVELGKSETAKPLLVYTPETYVNSLQTQSKNTDQNMFLRINEFVKKLLKRNDPTYKPFDEMDTKDFEDLYTVFQNLYKSLQAAGCKENEVLQKYFIKKKKKDAQDETEKLITQAQGYFVDTNDNYRQRQFLRKQGKPYKFAWEQYEPFENFDEWNWVENDLKAAESYYAQSVRENSDLYPFSTFSEWENEFKQRTGGLRTTRAASLAAAKHYRDGGSINETYPQETLKEWNDARVATEGPRVILPSEEVPQTPEWCFVALTSLFTQHPYVIGYFKENRIPIEIPAKLGQTLQKAKLSKDTEVASKANNELSGKVIFSVLLNFVTTYEPLQTNLASILAGEITDPSSYNLFAAYLKQKPLPETPVEKMAPPQEETQTIPISGTLPETMAPGLNSFERMELQKQQQAQQQAQKKPRTAAQIRNATGSVGKPEDIFDELKRRGQTEPVTDAYGKSTTYRRGGLGGLRKHGHENKSRSRKSTRRHYSKSPIHPFY